MKALRFYSGCWIGMFLLAPYAWGESALSSRVVTECTVHYSHELENWSGISPAARQRVAKTLCRQIHGEQMWNGRPLLIGLIGPSPRENSEILHAIRSLLFGTSNTLFRWRYGREALREWQAKAEGGLFGGVVTVEMEGVNASDTELQANRVSDALAYMSANQMDSFVLAIQSQKEETRKLLEEMNVAWVDLNTPECEGNLN
jgi:hypothetical protein